MATTIHEPPVHEPSKIDLTRAPRAASGGGGGIAVADGDLRRLDSYSPPPATTAVWVGIAAITMSFIAFTSALIVRKGGAPDWKHLILPPILYWNTLVLLVSSFTLEAARKQIGGYMRGTTSEKSAFWLHATLALGLLFVAGQYIAWLQLRAQGLYIATSPNSSFFYVFTTIHALHVLGGLLGLGYVIRRFHKGILRKSTLDATSHYWHFMDVLWLYLLFVLWSKI
ncbi:MAG: cytochrome c oxidase subunit 3 [Terriglobales bacterium]|jgi:cytochrome c oxidase subunit 3